MPGAPGTVLDMWIRQLLAAVAVAVLAASCTGDTTLDSAAAASEHAARACQVVGEAMEAMSSEVAGELDVRDVGKNRWGAPTGEQFAVVVTALDTAGDPAGAEEVARSWQEEGMAVVDDGPIALDAGVTREWFATAPDSSRFSVGYSTFDDGTSKVFADAEIAPPLTPAAANTVTPGTCPR